MFRGHDSSNSTQPVPRLTAVGRNGHHQQEARFSAIHDAERKALTSMERAPAAGMHRTCRMSRGAFDGGLHCSLETDTGTRARLAVVIDLMQQLRLGCWQELDGQRHFANARLRGQTRLQLAGLHSRGHRQPCRRPDPSAHAASSAALAGSFKDASSSSTSRSRSSAATALPRSASSCAVSAMERLAL